MRSSSDFAEMSLGGEAEAVDGVGPTVGPLPELVRGLGEGHVGGDGAVDDGLQDTNIMFTFIRLQQV